MNIEDFGRRQIDRFRGHIERRPQSFDLLETAADAIDALGEQTARLNLHDASEEKNVVAFRLAFYLLANFTSPQLFFVFMLSMPNVAASQ